MSAVGARRLVEVRALRQAELLGDVDLDVVDVVAVPDRLEQPVGEPEGEDVLRRFLAQEVVDPEDLLLVEDLVQLLVQLLRRGQVGAERLLHDDPGPRDEVGVVEHVHDGQGGLGRDAEVVQPARLLVAELPLGLGHGLAKCLGPTGTRGPAQPLAELRPALGLRSLTAVLRDGLGGELDERVPVVLVERGSDDLDLGEQAGLEQVQQPRKQLALGEVSGGTEQDDGGGGRHGNSLLPA